VNRSAETIIAAEYGSAENAVHRRQHIICFVERFT